MTSGEKNALLLERLINFSQRVIRLCQSLPKTLVNVKIIPQVVGSSDSMASNYAEACEAESAPDFIHKIGVVRKESRETRVHLRILYAANPKYQEKIATLGRESVEYIRIFSTIHRNFRKRKRGSKNPVTSMTSVKS